MNPLYKILAFTLSLLSVSALYAEQLTPEKGAELLI